MTAYTFYSDLPLSDDVLTILTYLGQYGALNIAPTEIEDWYRQFSNEVYCAGWIKTETDHLQEFANWLTKQKV